MPSAREIKLLDGSLIYDQNGQMMRREEISLANRQLSEAGQPMISIVSSSPEEQAQDLLHQYRDKLIEEAIDKGDDSLLDTVDSRAQELTDRELNKNSAIEELVAAKPKSNMSSRQVKINKILETTKGNPLELGDIQATIDRSLIPWVERRRGDGQPGDDAYWVGQDVFGFKSKADAIKESVLGARGDRNKLTRIKDRLVDYYGYGPIQANDQINAILEGKLERGNIADLAMGVPNASADEGINAAIMEASGIENWKANTSDPIHAVDHKARIGSGEPKGVDSQRRFGRDLNLSVYDNLPDARAAAAELNVNASDSEKLWQVLDRIGGSGRGFEGKYMANRLWNRNPSRNFLNQEDQFKKDYIISGDTRRVVMPDEDKAFFQPRRHGPYNPQLGDNYHLINLNRMREDLNNRSMGAIRSEFGNELFDAKALGRGRKATQLKLAMSPEMIEKYSQTDLLDSQVLDTVSRMRRRR